MDTADILFSLGVIVVFGIGAQWLSSMLRIPSIMLLLVLGVLIPMSRDGALTVFARTWGHTSL